MTRPAPHAFAASDATREAILLRATYVGPTGSGKTLSALKLAERMVTRLGLGPLYVVDSENRSALRYAYSAKTGKGYRFKHVPMPSDDYSPQSYMAAVDYCQEQGAGVILVDSLSHAWNGVNGVLEQVDEITKRSRSKNSFSEGWGEMTPIQNRLIQHLLAVRCHIIWTMRSKVHYDTKKGADGKTTPVKIGMAPIQREGVDYEPDLSFEMEAGGKLYVSKSRALDVAGLAPDDFHDKPGDAFSDIVIGWLEEADAPVPQPPAPVAPPRPVLPSPAALARWSAAKATDADIADIAASSDPKHRAMVFGWRLRIAETEGEVGMVAADIAKDTHEVMRVDMLGRAEARRVEMASKLGDTAGAV